MIENQPVISVIIPVYNAEKYLAQCLENLLCQTYKGLEIIVVNDGSTDASSEIAKRYPVRVIDQKNAGVSVARNVGIENARGDFVHFMDNDDLITLDFYERMLDMALLTQADMVCGEMVHERLSHRSIRFRDKLLLSSWEDKIQMTQIKTHGYSWRYLFRRAFLETQNLRFDPKLRTLEDVYFSLQAVYFANKIAFCPKAVYYYKHRGESLRTTSTREARRLDKENKAMVALLCNNFMKKHNVRYVSPSPRKTRYKLFGIPVLKKLSLSAYKERWYLLGIPIWQKKESV